MKKLLASLAAVLWMLATSATAAGGGHPLDRFPLDKLNDMAALQNGAKLFANYCLNCHGAGNMRYNRMRDIGLTEDQIKHNLMFAGTKVGDPMTVTLNPKQAVEWFGANPPDLSVIARSRASGAGSGADYIYTYLRTYYRDGSKATGWNNLVFPSVGMPHALWELQGQQRAVFADEKDPHDATKTMHVFKGFEPITKGQMTSAQYNDTVADLAFEQRTQRFASLHGLGGADAANRGLYSAVGWVRHPGSLAMQILVTHSRSARSHYFQLSRLQLAGFSALLVGVLLLLSGTVYHFVFLQAAREGWPVVSQIVKLVVRDEIAQRDRFMRENLDAMAQRVGEMQARLVRLDAISERVLGMAGVKPEETKALKKTDAVGKGGPMVPLERPGLPVLGTALDSLEETASQQDDLFTLAQSRLMEKRLLALMVPNSMPVDGPVGSGFGFRQDPFTGRAALHTGLDFPVETGTPVRAAAGGVVVRGESHPAYGNVLELDHGNGLVTRYAHLSKSLVNQGDLVRRGQFIGHVGSTGRSTGPHLHFEVLVDSVPHNPARFLGAEPGSTAHR
ncbi:hypothetical protein B566_EDAN019272 [Ephemera danica]|nr:hypothetical protein B566_EDAN019272 [Ephemera danica]